MLIDADQAGPQRRRGLDARDEDLAGLHIVTEVHRPLKVLLFGGGHANDVAGISGDSKAGLYDVQRVGGQGRRQFQPAHLLGRQGLGDAGSGVQKEESLRGHHQRLAASPESHRQRGHSIGDGPACACVQVEDGDTREYGSVSASPPGIVGHHKIAAIRGKRYGTGLRRNRVWCAGGQIPHRHHFDPVRREVGSVDHAPPVVQSDIGDVAGQADHRTERRRPRRTRRPQDQNERQKLRFQHQCTSTFRDRPGAFHRTVNSIIPLEIVNILNG
ncbi:MAG: hypothetical protein BWY79_02139 [Actinobacteria bacterium ADurb.Bin444]|nr:MAG: hypothetical protein BWY79_02139 [Actinobacteria bacterium ADurb.Bin444]